MNVAAKDAKPEAAPTAGRGGEHGHTESSIVFDISVKSGNIKANHLSEILKLEPVTLEVNEFTPESAKQFELGVAKALRTGQPILPIMIDSYGGQVYALFRMLDAINLAKERGMAIVTIVTSKAMSCGSVLLAAGQRRYVAKEAIVMVHDITSFNWGKAPEIKASAAHTEYLGKRLFSLLDSASGQLPGYWEKRVHDIGHAELYLTSGECLEAGLATHIGTPFIKMSIGIKYELDGKSIEERA